jgi:hypothetical protein
LSPEKKKRRRHRLRCPWHQRPRRPPPNPRPPPCQRPPPNDRFDDEFEDRFEDEFEDRFEDEFEDLLDDEFDDEFDELLPATCQRSPGWARSLPSSSIIAPIAPLGA